MRAVAGVAAAAALSFVILHASPFWPWRALCGPLAGTGFCDGAGLFGAGWLPMRGDWLAAALRGTWLADAALLVWALGAILLLSLAQRLWDAALR